MHTAPVNCIMWLKARENAVSTIHTEADKEAAKLLCDGGDKNGLIISGSDDELLYLIDYSPDFRNFEGFPLSKHTNRVYSMAYAPDEDLIVSGGNDRTLCLWSVEERRCMQCIDSGHSEPVRGLAWSGDGELIVSASNDCTMIFRKFNKKNKRIEETYTQLPQKHKDFIYNITISGNQHYVVSASTDTDVGFWDIHNKEFLALGKEHLSFVWHISASTEKDNKYYVASSSSDGTVFVWDVTYIDDDEIHPCGNLHAIPGIIMVGCDFSEARIESEALRTFMKGNGGVL